MRAVKRQGAARMRQVEVGVRVCAWEVGTLGTYVRIGNAKTP